MMTNHQLTPCLWFDSQAEEAASFYISIFTNSRIVRITRVPDAGQETHGRPAGSVLTVEFEIDGRPFTALNGGPAFAFNEPLSFQVHCKDQQEIDYYWDKLSTGGDPKAQQCGWLKDKYGLSWQVVPASLLALMKDHESGAARRTMEALLRMKKLDLRELERARQGHPGDTL